MSETVSSPPPLSPHIKPTPTDAFPTPTSLIQAETEAVLLQHLPSSAGKEGESAEGGKETSKDTKAQPVLEKQKHVQFLARSLLQGFPARYVSQDASQPWLMFWTVQGFSVLQVGLDPGNKQRIIDKVMTWQHPDGGFGGGPGQNAHLLPTYASVCTLAIVGRPGPGGGWDQIDREKLYNFFMSLKQKDGSFLVSRHSEVDVRGIYCLLITATLLNILTPELVAGTAEFIGSCQTYEGGFASASNPSYDTHSGLPLASPRPPLGEAHGGYTFCAVASWVLLQPYLDTLSFSPEHPRPSINLDNLLRWLVHMQGIEAELGGFKGRSNKLVDGCYAWWCGGTFALMEALGVGGLENAVSEEVPISNSTDPWEDVDDALYNEKALQEYLLYAGQHPAGGMRDKPPKNADAYHTLYCLSGLSSAQHHVYPSKTRRTLLESLWTETAGESNDELHKRAFTSLLSWIEEEGASKVLGGQANRLNATHPLTNLTMTHTEAICCHFYKKTVPPRPFKVPPRSSASASGATTMARS